MEHLPQTDKHGFCIHRWTTIKRWCINDKYHIIQRCRRCEEWVKRIVSLDDIDDLKPSLKTIKIVKEPRPDGL